MNELLLVGGGGHCHACIDVIETEGKHRIAGIVQPPSDGQDAVIFSSAIVGDCNSNKFS